VAQRWMFIESSGKEEGWAWRVLSIQGTIENQSETFETYGAAVYAAIVRGFDPRVDHWIVQTKHSTTHYEHGKAVVNVAHADHPSPPPQGSAARRTPGAIAAPPEHGKKRRSARQDR
jgi:hypothetical protein